MAIDIEWQVKPPTKKSETNQPQLFPRIVNADVVGDAELADKIAAHSGLSRGVVTNVLEDLADVLATMMHEGKEVSLSSIGRFRLSIGTDADISPDTVQHTQNLCARHKFPAQRHSAQCHSQPVISPSGTQCLCRCSLYRATASAA